MYRMDFRNKKFTDNLPVVSIGILSYNYGRFVEQTLESVHNQSYPNIELIITDDCSTDNSVHIIKEWINKNKINCQFIPAPKNKGIAASCNTIIKHSTGKYLALFASDDIMNPQRIEMQVHEMEQAGSEYAFCYSDAELINAEGEDRGIYSRYHKIGDMHEGNIFYKFLVQGFRIAAPTLFYRRNIFEKIGLYDERLSTEDFGIFLRVLPFYKVKFSTYTGLKYRIKEKSNTISSHLTDVYHRDRVYIYFRLYKTIRKMKEWKSLQGFVIQRINFHLIQLSVLKSAYFSICFFYLLRQFYFKIPFKRLISLQLKKQESKLV